MHYSKETLARMQAFASVTADSNQDGDQLTLQIRAFHLLYNEVCPLKGGLEALQGIVIASRMNDREPGEWVRLTFQNIAEALAVRREDQERVLSRIRKQLKQLMAFADKPEEPGIFEYRKGLDPEMGWVFYEYRVPLYWAWRDLIASLPEEVTEPGLAVMVKQAGDRLRSERRVVGMKGERRKKASVESRARRIKGMLEALLQEYVDELGEETGTKLWRRQMEAEGITKLAKKMLTENP